MKVGKLLASKSERMKKDSIYSGLSCIVSDVFVLPAVIS